jgi:hypothetical protein
MITRNKIYLQSDADKISLTSLGRTGVQFLEKRILFALISVQTLLIIFGFAWVVDHLFKRLLNMWP